MKRLGITQRVSTNFHDRPHDCLDHAWSDLCAAIGVQVTPLPNLEMKTSNIRQFLSSQNLCGLILSGGNDIDGLGEIRGSQASARRDAFEREALAWARSETIPILGVCRGMQFMNHVMDGKLTGTAGHAGVRHDIQMSAGNLPDYFAALPAGLTVNSFHTFSLPKEGLAEGLQAAAFDTTGQIEAFYHEKEFIAGIMWHPERESPFSSYDIALLRNFFRI